MKIKNYIILLFCIVKLNAVDPFTIITIAGIGITVVRCSYSTVRWYCYPTVEQELIYEKNQHDKQKEQARLSFNKCISKSIPNKSQCETLYNEWKILAGFRKSH